MPAGHAHNKDFPINSVSVVIGVKTKKSVEDVIHFIDGEEVTITDCHHQIVKKMKPKKVDGDIIGYEPTGEETLILKVKYIRE
jgi:hypothetical protein